MKVRRQIRQFCIDMRCEQLFYIVVYVNKLLNQGKMDRSSIPVKAMIICDIFFKRLEKKGCEYPQQYIVGAFLVAMKLEDDYSITNQEWAEVVGFSVQIVNFTEREFCKEIDYELFVSREEYLRVYQKHFDIKRKVF